jgi:hypothetical protein
LRYWEREIYKVREKIQWKSFLPATGIGTVSK